MNTPRIFPSTSSAFSFLVLVLAGRFGKSKARTFRFGEFFVASLLFATISLATLRAEAPRSDVNPALLYFQAFLVAPDMPETDLDYLANNNLWIHPLPKKFGELIARYDSEFKLLRQAILSNGLCDWGIDFSPGPATLLPHLARCKAAMIGARYRVAWHLQNQQQAEARDDLVAAFTLARNIGRDGTLISVLVQIAAENIGCNIIAENFGKFDPETLQQLVQGIDAAPARVTVAASVGFEKITFHDWLVRKILTLQKNNPGDDAKVMSAVHELVSGFDDVEHKEPDGAQSTVWEQLIRAGGNNSDGVLKLLNEESAAYDRLAAVMALPYAEFERQAQEITGELRASPNPLISQVIPAASRARQREFKVQVWLAMLHTAVQYRLHGESGLLNVNDPCGQGPFSYQRFILDGIDRGFSLRSSFEGSGFREMMIFIEKPGRPFLLDGPHAGEPRSLPKNQK